MLAQGTGNGTCSRTIERPALSGGPDRVLMVGGKEILPTSAEPCPKKLDSRKGRTKRYMGSFCGLWQGLGSCPKQASGLRHTAALAAGFLVVGIWQLHVVPAEEPVWRSRV